MRLRLAIFGILMVLLLFAICNDFTYHPSIHHNNQSSRKLFADYAAISCGIYCCTTNGFSYKVAQKGYSMIHSNPRPMQCNCEDFMNVIIGLHFGLGEYCANIAGKNKGKIMNKPDTDLYGSIPRLIHEK